MWETVLQVKRLNQQYQSTEGTKNTQITNNTISEHTKTQFFISLIIVYCDHLHIFPYSSLSFCILCCFVSSLIVFILGLLLVQVFLP